MKKLIIITIIVDILISILGCSENSNIMSENNQLEIIVINAGKADACIIKIGHKAILIDTGLNADKDELVNRLKEEGINTLEYLILTHNDKDHIGGADKVLDNIKINNVIAADYVKESKQYTQYIESLEKNNITPLNLKENLNAEIDGVSINIYPAQKEYYEQSNDYSIITEITYGKYNYLFAGDAEDERLSEFLSSNSSRYTFVKMPHHGAYDGLTDTFIKSVKPQYAVITCSKEDYADKKTLELLKQNNSKIYLTCEGDVIIKSDGNSISIEQ